MFELVQAGGWLMGPIILCSVIAMAIILERLWAYRGRKVIPSNLVAQIWQLHQKGQITAGTLRRCVTAPRLGVFSRPAW